MFNEPLVLGNVRIVGSDSGPVDVACEGGFIRAVGSHIAAPGHRLDLDGAWVMPGLWDHHVHFTQWSRSRGRLDVSAANSAMATSAVVGEAVRHDSSTSATLIGCGFRDALWPDLPTVDLLDAVAPDRPVVLISADLHAVWVNTAAQHRYGLAHGGLLREADAFAVQTYLAEVSHDDLHTMTASAMADAAARGVVGMVDLEMDDAVGSWRRRNDHGLATVRVRAGFYPRQMDEVAEWGLASGAALTEDGLVTLGPLKIMTDGSLNTRTAYCHDPYPDSVDHGVCAVAPDDLRMLMDQAREADWEVAVHAIGDLANTQALDAFAETHVRGSIEHAQLIRTEDIARFAELGVVASVQPEHLLDDRDVADQIWPERTGRAYPFASLAAAGARLAFGSDAPVAPLDPWLAIAAAVERTRDERPAWHPEQAISVAQALAASMPAGAAVTPGAVADVVVVAHDPLDQNAPLRDMPVVATVVAGGIVFLDGGGA